MNSSTAKALLVSQVQVALQNLLEASLTFPENQQAHVRHLNYHFADGPLAPIKAAVQAPPPSVAEKLATTSTTTPSGKKGVSLSKSNKGAASSTAKSVEQFRQDVADNMAAADAVMVPLVGPTTVGPLVGPTTTPSISDSTLPKKRSNTTHKDDVDSSSVKRVKTHMPEVYESDDVDKGQGTEQRLLPLPVEDNDDGDSAFKLKEEKEMQSMRDRASKVTAAREAKELAEREAAKEREAKEQAAKEQAAKEQAAKEQAAKEQAAKEQAAKEQAAKEREAKERAKQVKQDALKEMLRRQEEERQRQEEERQRLLAEMAAIDNDNDD